MKYISILGFGVVGGGIPDVIDSWKENIRELLDDDIEVKYILDLREFKGTPYEKKVVHDIDIIARDPDISVVAETMGGSHPAYEYSVALMNAGKSVVSSNKEVVANFGDKLLECAKKNNVSYYFEASVGGAIPEIRPFFTSLSAANIRKISGILNGTTNYILSNMEKSGRDFSDMLSEAQRLGYAEKDPSADIDAVDTKRKIIILTALASGCLLSEDDVYSEGIRNISSSDFEGAKKAGGTVKLVGVYERKDDTLCAYVCPMIVDKELIISSVNDVFNAVLVDDEMMGEVMYYGRGAGRYPTASAILSDILAILSGCSENEKKAVFCKGKSEFRVLSFDEIDFRFYVRFEYSDRSVLDRLRCEKVLEDDGRLAEVVTEEYKTDELKEILSGCKVVSLLRFYRD